MSAPTQGLRRFDIRRLQQGETERVIDTVAAEEPLQISIAYHFKGALRCEQLAVTMRTPGHDRELCAGFLLTEGIICSRHDIVDLRLRGGNDSNEIVAEMREDVDVDSWRHARNGFVGASCGICGKNVVEAARVNSPVLSADGMQVSWDVIQRLPELVREHQSGFSETGGLHAAALADTSANLQIVFEDIGRHNALDKLIGHAVLNGITPLQQSVVLLSSRSSFELIQKAAMAGVPVLATIGGPSSLAIEAARELGMTLIGFLRGDRCNVYSGEWRIQTKRAE